MQTDELDDDLEEASGLISDKTLFRQVLTSELSIEAVSKDDLKIVIDLHVAIEIVYSR